MHGLSLSCYRGRLDVFVLLFADCWNVACLACVDRLNLARDVNVQEMVTQCGLMLVLLAVPAPSAVSDSVDWSDLGLSSGVGKVVMRLLIALGVGWNCVPLGGAIYGWITRCERRWKSKSVKKNANVRFRAFSCCLCWVLHVTG